MRKLAMLLMAAVLLMVVTACTSKAEIKEHGLQVVSAAGREEDKVIKLIMNDGGFNPDIVTILRDEVAEQGFTLDLIVAGDIVEPNKRVDDGSADASFFQHEAYFNQFVSDHNLKNIVRGFYVLSTPSALYSKKAASLDQVPDGASIAIPVDASNNGRALLMLQRAGLLKLRNGVEVTLLGLKDIVDNPHQFKFKEVQQQQLQRALDEADVGFLFAGTAVQLGLNPMKDSLVYEDDPELPYKSIVAVRKDVAGSAKIKALQNAFASGALKAFYKEKYGDSVRFLDELNKK